MFKFGFSPDNEEIGEINPKDEEPPKILWKESKEVIYTDHDIDSVRNVIEHVSTKTVDSFGNKIKYLCSKELIDLLLKNEQQGLDESVLKSEKNHSDLLPAVYEGGFKIWECTYDLLNYMGKHNMNFKDVNVLDLGCGAGIIGIATLLCGAKCYFQDYNSDVLQYVTITNVLLNSKNGTEKCKFYSGDWTSFVNSVEAVLAASEDRFDYIFTSETIYNIECYPKLHQVFEKLLKRNGSIYLAAKSFYFGVGGGITLFQDFLDQQKVFKYETCWKCEEGVNREIMKIEFI